MTFDRYWVYRSWGRINEDIGGNKLQQFQEKAAAIKNFEGIFHQKTKNPFNAKTFRKLPRKYFQVPQSSKPIQKPYKLVDSQTLHGAVQKLLKLLLSEEIMFALMVSFHLDLNKIPLGKAGGKVRRQQIVDGFRVLEQIQQKIEENESHESLIESSNRFYSIIPHKASSEHIIVSRDDLAEKAQMLQDLRNVQFTYDFLYKTGDCGKNILDDFYVKLNNCIEPLDDCEQFQMIKNAFDSTNSGHNCQIERIFQIQRNAEEANRNGHEPFYRLGNHQLLWHGTRITNVHQILTYGIKIAPPQALTTGWRLGKGVYFTDAVAEAMKHCHVNESKNIGVILLYEVALGNPKKYYHPENVVELPDGHHSAHGVAEISPQSTERIYGEVFIHSGPMKKDYDINTDIDYNEFVVYNEQQVKLKYLVQWKLHASNGPFMPMLKGSSFKN